MRIKSILGFVFSLVAVLGINFIPLEMWLYRDFSGESAMFFYAIENVVAIIFAVIFVILLAPLEEENPDYRRRAEIPKENQTFPIVKVRKRSEILQGYLVFSLGFSGGSIIFLSAFIFLILKTKIQFAAIATALLWITGFQFLEFFGNFLMLRPLNLARAEVFLKRSMGRIALLFLSVFGGMFLALFVDKWFVVPFIVLKTIVDFGEQIQIFKGLRFK